MAQVVPSVARFECRYRSPDDVVENVYYVRTSDSTWPETSLDDVAAAIETWENGVAKSHRSTAVGLFEIIATDLTSLFGIRKAYSIDPQIQGTLTNGLPLNATVAIKANIGRRGRGVAGRTFWIGLAQSQLISADQLDSTAGLALVGVMNDLLSAIAAITPIEGMVVPHFVVNHVRPATVDADVIVDYVLSDFFVDSQRDRLPRHKKHKRLPVA